MKNRRSLPSWCDLLCRHTAMITISSAISWNNVAGELALFDPRDGRYHVLNGSAATIWRGIAEGLPIAVIARRLADRHAAPPDLIAAEVAAFVDAALSGGLLLRVGDGD